MIGWFHAAPTAVSRGDSGSATCGGRSLAGWRRPAGASSGTSVVATSPKIPRPSLGPGAPRRAAARAGWRALGWPLSAAGSRAGSTGGAQRRSAVPARRRRTAGMATPPGGSAEAAWSAAECAYLIGRGQPAGPGPARGGPGGGRALGDRVPGAVDPGVLSAAGGRLSAGRRRYGCLHAVVRLRTGLR